MANVDKKYIEGCPNCTKKIPLSESEKMTGYGARIKTCPDCNYPYLDWRVKELGISGIQKDDRRLIRSSCFWALIIGITMFLLALCFVQGSSSRVVTSSKTEMGTAAMFILGPFLIGYGIISAVKDIKNYKRRRLFLDEELKLSNERLKDLKYSDLLSKLEFLRNK